MQKTVARFVGFALAGLLVTACEADLLPDV